MTPRERISEWLEREARFPVPGRDTRVVRAALEIIDSHYEASDGWPFPCAYKTRDEAALWKALSGEEEA